MTVRLVLLAVIVGAILALPAPAQLSGEHHIRRTDDDRSLDVAVRGKIWFTDDDRDVARIEDGGRLMIEERRRGSPERMLIVTSGSGGQLQRTYLVNGRTTEWNVGAADWLAGLLPELIRESGIGAEERARRILDRHGADGVIAEAEQIRSSSTRRRYLTIALNEGRLGSADGARALRAVQGIGSSSEKATLLILAADHLSLADRPMRDAYFEAARSISSGSNLRRVLDAVLEEGPVGQPVLIDALDAARRISSSSERAPLLSHVAERHKLSTDAARDAFFAAADEISSSAERRRVLIALLRHQGSDEAVLRGVVRSARTIGSDSEKAAVLMEASARSVPPG